MRIVVNDIAASKTGALAILKDFYEYVRENAKDQEWIFLTGGDYLEETDNIKVHVLSDVKKSGRNRLVFDFIKGRKYIESLQPDVILSLQNTLTTGTVRKPDGKKVPQLLYVHQPLGYQQVKKFSFFNPEEREYAIYQYLIGATIDASVKRADKVVVQTEWMREAVAKKTGVPLSKIEAILPTIPDLSSFQEDGVWSRNSFFFPSGEILYKNHECILKAAAILNKKGVTDFKVHFTLKALADVTKRVYPDPHHNIYWSGRISRDEVLSLYNKSTLIFPSYIETFGVPLAEARQLGTLILASDCPFSREVLKGYENARFFNPFDENALAALMEDVITGKLSPAPVKTEYAAGENSYAKILDLLFTSST